MIGVFAKNTVITFITRVLTAIFGIAITIIIARVLGPEKQGIYSLAILLPSTLLIFTVLGINVSSTFYVGKKKYTPEEVFSSNIFFTVFLSILTFLIGLIIIFLFSDKFFPGVEKIYLFLALSLIPFNLFFVLISSILLGMQEIKKYNIISFLQVFIFLLLVSVFILGFHFGVMITILAQTLSFVLAGTVLFFVVKKEIRNLILKFNKKYFKDAISYGLKNYLGGILYFLHHKIDMFLINLFINPIAVGFYYVAVRLAEGIWLISQSAATVLFPKVAAETDGQRLKNLTPLVCRNVLSITFLISVVLFVFSHWVIIFFYSENFLNSVRPFQILLVGTLFIAGWTILANDIGGRGKPMINAYVSGFSVMLNVILNILLIPKWGIEGAAIATGASYFVVFIITVFVYAKISGNRIVDIIIPKKSDLIFYKNIMVAVKEKTKNL